MKAHPSYLLLFGAVFFFSCNSQPSENNRIAKTPNHQTETPVPDRKIPEKEPTTFLPEPEKPESIKAEPGFKRRKRKHVNPEPARTAETSTTLAAAPPTFAEPEPEQEQILSVADIYKHFEKTPQTFSLTGTTDTTIICQEGASLKIPANAFVSEKTGKEVTGLIQLSVKEYYQLSDMLLANLSTTSGSRILETGGMLHLTATSANNENLILKPDQKIEIGFPYETAKPDMQLFTGNWKNEQIDWELTENDTPTGLLDRDTVEVRFSGYYSPPAFPGGTNGLQRYLTNIKLPFSLLDKVISEERIVRFVVDSTGQVGQINVERGGDSTVAKLAYYVVSKMPKWKPAKFNNKPISNIQAVQVKVKFQGIIDKDKPTHSKPLQRLIEDSKVLDEKLKSIEVVYFEMRMPTNTNDQKFKEGFEAQVNNSNLNQTSVAKVNQYLLSTSQLGWINCDRFYKNEAPKIDYVIDTGNEQKSVVSVVFHTAKSIMPSNSIIKNSHIVSLVPLDEKVTIVAFKTENNQVQLAVKETTISRAGEKDLIFEPVTMAKLKEEMVKLNRIN